MRRYLLFPSICLLVTLAGCNSSSKSVTQTVGAVLSPTSLAFPGTPVGTTATGLSTTLSNTGNSTLTISGITITGAGAADFAESNTCGSTLAAAATCTITVTFKPATAANFSAVLSVADNASSSPQTVALSGSGGAPIASFSTTAVVFPTTLVNTTSAAFSVTVTNTGSAVLTLSSASLGGMNPGQFAISSNTCGSSLAIHASCAVALTFSPTTATTYFAVLSLANNATGSPQQVTLQGTGGSPGISVVPPVLTFPDTPVGGTSAAMSSIITNNGTTALNITSSVLNGTNPADFAVTVNTCTGSIAPGASCTVTTTFSPVSVGSFLANVSIYDNVVGSPQTVTLTGNGINPGATLSPTALAFPNTVVGSVGSTLSTTLTSSGTTPLILSNISIAGTNPSDFTESNSCGTTLAPGATCKIYVTFNPAALASYSAQLNLADNALTSPQTVLLSGTGIPLPMTNTCGTPQTTSPTLPAPTANYGGVAFTGSVKAGTVGLIGASVQIYVAGTTGNGSTPTALGAALTTDGNGNFSVPAMTYPYSNSVVYAVATGGQAGAGGAVNPGTVLMSVLGVANGLASNGNYTLNEATTVASAYAMAQFLAPGASMGATSTNASGIGLAAGTVANLVNITTGAEPGTYFPSTGTAPTARINSLANLLNACIVSSGAGSSACTGLYSDTTTSSSTPSNTLDAVLNIAKNPGTDVAQLYGLSFGSSAYSPALVAQPSDWTMFVTYSGGGMNDPSAIGVDSLGNVWVANYFNTVSYFSNTGNASSSGITGGQLEESYGGAVDYNNDFWAVNEQSSGVNNNNGTVDTFNASGSLLNTLSTGGLDFPLANAFDTSAKMWVVNYGNSSVSIYATGESPTSATSVTGSPYISSQLEFPVAVALDPQCNAFVANQSSNTITKVIGDGSSFTSFAVGDGPSGVAVDESGNAWSANYYGNSVGLLSAQGHVLSGSGITGGGLVHPQGIAIDGNGTAWVANYRGPSISELAAATTASPGALLSPSNGWGADAKLLEAFAIAADASGNLWVSNFGSNTLTEFVGMAAPVQTPLLGTVRVP